MEMIFVAKKKEYQNNQHEGHSSLIKQFTHTQKKSFFTSFVKENSFKQ